MTRTSRIIYLDLSFTGLQILKHAYGAGFYVVADCTNLPFKPEVFSHTINSEVLEHVEDDRKALNELARVTNPSGRIVLTFPHKKSYFTNDDRFVNHLRRYELSEMQTRLTDAGFRTINTRKVLGPLEKITMCFVVCCFALIQNVRSRKVSRAHEAGLMNVLGLLFKWANRFYMLPVWLDAKIMPCALSAVLLIKAEKMKPKGQPCYSGLKGK